MARVTRWTIALACGHRHVLFTNIGKAPAGSRGGWVEYFCGQCEKPSELLSAEHDGDEDDPGIGSGGLRPA